MRTLFLVKFYISVLDSIQKQGSLEKNLNNLICTHQNLVELKTTKNRQTMLQHIKILDLNEIR